MKFLFIIQGEGTGHLSQALSLEEMLIKNGHEVIEVLVGNESHCTLPGFFNRNINAPVKRFLSPSTSTLSEGGSQTRLRKKLVDSLINAPEYYRSMCYINDRIHKTGAEVVINFYELLTGLTYALFRPSVPYICIGHQYMFLHPDYDFPTINYTKLLLLRFYTRMTSFRSSKRIGLSFKKMSDNKQERLVAVPPLIRKEIVSISPYNGEYVNGIMSNEELLEDINRFHAAYPDVSLRLFWNNSDADEETIIDNTLSFHLITDSKFLNYIGKCKVLYSNAGFESICEAMYLGKPLMMHPYLIDQICYAHNAQKLGAGIINKDFDVNKILHYAETYKLNREFIYWARSSERQILNEIEKTINHNIYSDVPDYSECMV